MKYISFVVPSYNSEAYLHKCLDSLVIGGDDVEVIVVNDGSKDNTLAVARDYEQRYPNIIKVIDQENGGHGSGVNAGIKNATGLYFKCVDSDDWVDEEAYKKVLAIIKKHHEDNQDVDLYLTNFVYENLEKHTQKLYSLEKYFPKEKICTWNEVRNFMAYDYFMMHCFIYKTSVLRESHTELLKHTFYVDNIFVYQPLPYVKTIYYIHADFYRYYVGRSDQSINIANIVKRYDHQIRVMDRISKIYTYDYIKSLPRKIRNIIIHELVIVEYLTMFYITEGSTPEKEKMYKEYWASFKKENSSLYYKIRYRTYFWVGNLLYYCLPLRKIVINIGYKILIKKTDWC